MSYKTGFDFFSHKNIQRFNLKTRPVDYFITASNDSKNEVSNEAFKEPTNKEEVPENKFLNILI